MPWLVQKHKKLFKYIKLSQRDRCVKFKVLSTQTQKRSQNCPTYFFLGHPQLGWDISRWRWRRIVTTHWRCPRPPWRRIVTTHSLPTHCPLTTHYPLSFCLPFCSLRHSFRFNFWSVRSFLPISRISKTVCSEAFFSRTAGRRAHALQRKPDAGHPGALM